MNGIIADIPTTSIAETKIEKKIKKIIDFLDFLLRISFNFVKYKLYSLLISQVTV